MNLLNRFFKRHPSEPASYFDLFDKPIDYKLPGNELPFVVLDTETTGLNKEDTIVSIGAVQVFNCQIHPGKVIDTRLSNKNATNDPSAIAIHELIGEVEVNNRQLIAEFMEFVNRNIIVGHHIQFDIQKINQWIQEEYPEFSLQNKILDTAHLAKRIHKEEVERQVGGGHFLGLDNLCDLYEIPIENRHMALGDAYMRI